MCVSRKSATVTWASGIWTLHNMWMMWFWLNLHVSRTMVDIWQRGPIKWSITVCGADVRCTHKNTFYINHINHKGNIYDQQSISAFKKHSDFPSAPNTSVKMLFWQVTDIWWAVASEAHDTASWAPPCATQTAAVTQRAVPWEALKRIEVDQNTETRTEIDFVQAEQSPSEQQEQVNTFCFIVSKKNNKKARWSVPQSHWVAVKIYITQVFSPINSFINSVVHHCFTWMKVIIID